MPCSRLRVVLADDHPMMLEGLRKLLKPDFEVVGAVTDGRALLEAAQRLQPDLVITDISMPGMDGLEATRRLRAVVPGVRVLVLSVHTEPAWVRAAFEAGACGYLSKTSAAQEIESAVRAILEGHFYVSPTVTQSVIITPAMDSVAEVAEVSQRTPPEPSAALTPRELDIVRLVGLGLGNKEIAHRLGVSVPTVRSHLNNVYGKLGTASRVELALLAAQTGGVVM